MEQEVTEKTEEPTGETEQLETQEVDVEALKAENEDLRTRFATMEKQSSKHANEAYGLRQQLARDSQREETLARLDARMKATMSNLGIDEADIKAPVGNQLRQEVDPDAQAFGNYLRENELEINNPEVLEAVDGRTAVGALKALRKTMADKAQKKLDKVIEAKTQEKVQQLQKESGLTTSEGSPSGNALPTIGEIAKMSTSEYRKHQTEIDKAMQAGYYDKK